jgi:transcriptional regulator with XRE-family HTH domain
MLRAMTVFTAPGPDDEVSGSFGTLLRGYRSASGLTQEDLAERSGVSVRAIADMERGRTTRPFRHSVRRLADALDMRDAEREQLENARRPFTASILLTGDRDAIGAAVDQGLLARTPENEQGRRAVPGQGNERDQATVPRQLPPSAAHFVGRRDELRELNGALARREAAGETVPILAIVGTAGVGKTALAVHWARQVANRFPDGQLYVDLRGFDPTGDPLTPAAAIHGFLHALGRPSARMPVAVQAAAGQYRSLLAGLRMLIVLDNARDPEQVRPLLPGAPGCAVVVTSRNQLTGLVVADGARPLFLDVLARADAFELLARWLGMPRLRAEPQAAEELIGLSARLPLALAVVAARAAARPGLTLRDLAADLRDSGRRLDAVETGEPATSLRAMLAGSFRLLTGPAAQILGVLSLRSGPEFSAAATASLAGIPVSQARALLGELTRASLVTERPRGQFTLHAFLRSYAAERASIPASAPGAGAPPPG